MIEKKSLRAALTLGLCGVVAGLAGCNAPADDDPTGADTAAVINVTDAKVSLCGQEDEERGCTPCPPLKIPGDPVDAEKIADACTLKALRDPLKKRVMVLMAEAGRRGRFMRTASGETPVRLSRISVVTEIGGARNSMSQQTRLSGSFTLGEENQSSGARGGVTVYSVYMPVRFVFEFEDKTGAVVRHEPFAMRNTYDLVPFFYMKGELAVNLNLGGILSKFGPGPVSSALLAALGGQASLAVSAEQETTWTTPACADGDLLSERRRELQAFDADFLENVLVPMCRQYNADNGAGLDCTMDVVPVAPLVERFEAMTRQRVLPLEACTEIDAPWLGSNVYKVSFVAPERWGFEAGQEVFAYGRNASATDVWKRESNVVVLGVDKQKCGARALADGEVCVHGRLGEAWFGGACASIAQPGRRLHGVAQDNADDTDAMIQYALPE